MLILSSLIFSAKVLKFEQLYLEQLPLAEMYEKSFMHRDVVTFVAITKTDFIITASADGHVKFWKKQPVGVEFVKHFRSHLGKYWKNSIIIIRILLI